MTAAARSWTQLTARHVLLGWLALVLLLAGWAAGAAALAAWHLSGVRDTLVGLRDEEDTPPLGELRRTLDQTAQRAATAHGLLRQPGPALVARLPVLGRSLAAEREAAAVADAVLGSGKRLLPLALDVEVDDGQVDVRAVGALQQELVRSAEVITPRLLALEQTDLRATPAPVREAVTSAREALAGLDRELVRAADLLSAAEGLLGADGPRTVVVAVMNNAELRGAGGYAGTVGVVRTSDGRLDVSPFRDVEEFAAQPEAAVRVPAPPDYARRWGPFLADTTLWKEVMLSAHDPATAAVTCEVAKLAPGVPCDAVVLLDVPALAQLMTLSGPVTLPDGERVERDELVRALLVEAYEDVPDEKGPQAARRAGLRRAADNALRDLLAQQVDGAEAVRVLLRAAQGRHLALWSARLDEQRALERSGAAGSADPQGADLSLAAFNQFVAGKLDYYVDRTVEVDVEVSPTRAQVRQSVSMALDLPPGLPEYVLGVRDGRLLGVLDLALAADATIDEVTLDGKPVPHGVTFEAGSQRVVLEPDLLPGARGTWAVTYDVPLRDGAYRLEVLPQPLARDAQLRLSVRAAPGSVLRDGDVAYDGPHDRRRTVQVAARRR